MTRGQIEHAIREACEIYEDSEIWIFGSQAILGEFPNAPAALRTSIEVNVQPKNRPDKINVINDALGELSLFHQTHGFYVRGLSADETEMLPQGWEARVTPIFDEISTNSKTGWCIETHDLGAGKLAAYREKDRDFVRILLIEGMVNPDILTERIHILRVAEPLRDRLVQWVKFTAEEL